MIRRILMSISGRLPCKIIKDGDQPYLERYYLCTLFDVRFYLHRFVASDPDRGVHDHPWRWAFSIILAGWYLEESRYFASTRPVRWFNFLTGESFHRVLLPYGTQVWTLFAHKAGRAKKWGFLRDKGQLGIVYIPHTQKKNEPEDWWTTAPKGKEFRHG